MLHSDWKQLFLLVALLPGFVDARESREEQPEVLVSAAASLRSALQETVERFKPLYPGGSVALNTASSGVLLTQIEHGAPVDLFLSASSLEIDRLVEQGLVWNRSRVPIASNRIVVVVPRGQEPPGQLEDLAGPRFDRIAIGNPSTVPQGRYAKQALQTLGLWETIEARIVLAENARQVLDYVSRGEVSAALVYATDAILLPDSVTEGPLAPAGSHAFILYEGAVPKEAPHPQRGHDLLDFLISEEGQEILARKGFLPPPGQ